MVIELTRQLWDDDEQCVLYVQVDIMDYVMLKLLNYHSDEHLFYGLMFVALIKEKIEIFIYYL